jgi:hypothetical protein
MYDRKLATIISKIANAGTPMASIAFNGYFLVKGTQKVDMMHLASVEVIRDYNTNVTDRILVTCTMPGGNYINYVYPNRDYIELVLTYSTSEETITRTYKALVVNNRSNIDGTYLTHLSKDEINKLDLRVLEVDCYERTFDALRLIPVFGVYKNTTVSDLIIGSIKKSAEDKLKTINNRTSALQINMVAANNQIKYPQIVIPQNTGLFDIVPYLQIKSLGVYNGGAGCYLQYYNNKEYLFIHPLYGVNWFQSASKKLMIYNTVIRAYDDIKTTYLCDGDIVKIIATSNMKTISEGQNKIADTGTAFAASSQYTLLERNVNVTDDSISVSRTDNAIEQKDARVTNRDGGNKINIIGPTTNLYHERSIIIRKSMQVMQVQWNFCNPNLIYPGMPVQFIKENNKGELVALTGTVASFYFKYYKAQKNILALLNIMVG